MNPLRFFVTPLRSLPPIAIVLSVAIGFGLWEIIDNSLDYLLYPVIHYATGLDLRDLHVTLPHDQFADPFTNTVFFGPIVAAGLTTLLAGLILFVAFRWLWEEASEGEVECPYCLSQVPAEAVKCAYCASDLPHLNLQDET